MLLSLNVLVMMIFITFPTVVIAAVNMLLISAAVINIMFVIVIMVW